MMNRRPEQGEAVLGQTSVATPVLEQAANRQSVIGHLQDYQQPSESDDSAYSGSTSKLGSLRSNSGVPSSFSRPVPGNRDNRYSVDYPATLNSVSRPATANRPPPTRIADFPEVPKNAVATPRPAQGLESPIVSPVHDHSPSDSHRNAISPLAVAHRRPDADGEPIRQALRAITDGPASASTATRFAPASVPQRTDRYAPNVHHQNDDIGDGYTVAMPPQHYQDPRSASTTDDLSPARSHEMMNERRYDQDTLEPVLDLALHPPQLPLTFKPLILRPLLLALFILVLSAYTALLVYVAIRSHSDRGLLEYLDFGDARYFVFQYLPSIAGTIILLWLFEIEIALFRIAPFIAMSSDNDRTRSQGAVLPIYPSGFILPTFSHGSAGLYCITFFLFVSWLSIFTIPLLATSFNVYGRDDTWFWLATQGVIWTVITLYALLILATIILFLYLLRRKTGLKWDPRSLADIVVLLSRSNLLAKYAAHTDDTSLSNFRDEVEARGDRLGYWYYRGHPKRVFHTLGAPNLIQTANSPLEATRLLENKAGPRRPTHSISGRPFSHSPSAFNGRSNDDIDEYLPWFLRPLSALIWAFLALALAVAFLVVSFLPATAVENGFFPQLPVPVDRHGFSSPNFLYSFVPALLGLLCLLFWYSIDLNLRRLQLYASLSQPDGAEAQTSLLLDYVACGPCLVTIRALRNKHIRIALVSLNTLIATSLPVLAGGIFWAQFFIGQQRIRISSQMPAFYALTVLFTLYALGFVFLLPKRARTAQQYSIPNPATVQHGMTNRGRSLIEHVALIHHSRLLTDNVFRDSYSHVQLDAGLRARRADIIISSPSPALGVAAGGAGESSTEPSPVLPGTGHGTGITPLTTEPKWRLPPRAPARYKIGRFVAATAGVSGLGVSAGAGAVGVGGGYGMGRTEYLGIDMLHRENVNSVSVRRGTESESDI